MDIITPNYSVLHGSVFDKLDTLPDESIDLCITDPPYFVMPKGRVAREENRNYKVNEWDDFSSMGHFTEFTKKWFDLLYKKMKPNSFTFIFWSQKHFLLGTQIFNPSRMLVWSYSNLISPPQKGMFTYDYEPIFVIMKGNPKLAKHSKTIMNFTKPQSNFKSDKAIYPTQKPRKLVAHLLDVVGLPKGSLVLDCFQGSGIVGEQALKLGYKYIGIDNSDDSIEVSREILSNAIK